METYCCTSYPNGHGYFLSITKKLICAWRLINETQAISAGSVQTQQMRRPISAYTVFLRKIGTLFVKPIRKTNGVIQYIRLDEFTWHNGWIKTMTNNISVPVHINYLNTVGCNFYLLKWEPKRSHPDNCRGLIVILGLKEHGIGNHRQHDKYKGARRSLDL